MKKRKSPPESPQSPSPSTTATTPTVEPRRSWSVISETDRLRLLSDPDFVLSRHCGNNIANLIRRYPDGMQMAAIARVLALTEEEAQAVFQRAMKKMREVMT
jgi:hypothetical protein